MGPAANISREANDLIRRAAERLSLEQGVPFLCECGEPQCRETIRTWRREYERVRLSGWFFCSRDHAPTDSSRIVADGFEFLAVGPEPKSDDPLAASELPSPA